MAIGATLPVLIRAGADASDALVLGIEGADLTLYLRPQGGLTRRLGLGLYGGALWSVNSRPEEASLWRGRVGAEADP